MSAVEPTISSVARAWRIPRTEAVTATHVREFGYEDAGIDQWIINGPYHPAWSWWYVGAVHLRDIPGAPPARKNYPEAEYEFFIYSLEVAPDVEALRSGVVGSMKFLAPPDVVYQLDGLTDDQVKGLVEVAVAKICDGQSCDSDYRSWWVEHLNATVGLIRQANK